MRERDRNKKKRKSDEAQGWAVGKKKRKTMRARGREGERWMSREKRRDRWRERERREGRAVDGLDIVSAESSSIKSNYDVIDRGPVGRGRGDAEGEAKSSE